MHIIRVLLTFVEVVCSLLLIGVILLQKTKREGLGLAFGAGMGEQLFGSRAGNVLTKATIVLSCVFLLNTSLLALTHSAARPQSVVDKYGPAPAQAAPAQPAELPTAPQGEQPFPSAPIAMPESAAQPPLTLPGAGEQGAQPLQVPMALPVEVGPGEMAPGLPVPAAPAQVTPPPAPAPAAPVQIEPTPAPAPVAPEPTQP